MCGKAKLNRNQRRNAKASKMQSRLITCDIADPSKRTHLDEINHSCLVVDGGSLDTPRLSQMRDDIIGAKKYKCMYIHNGDLEITNAHLDNPSKGLIFSSSVVTGDEIAPFILAPRDFALNATGLTTKKTSEELNDSFHAALQCQLNENGPYVRGASKPIFTDEGKIVQYCTLGAQAKRSGRGVREVSFHARHMTAQHWTSIHDFISRSEHVREAIVPTSNVRKMKCAHNLIGYKTFPKKRDGSPSSKVKMNQSAAVGLNVHLSCHVDSDYDLSTACVLKRDHHCKMKDEVVVYFCFPRLGIAVPLRPGDILLFNAREPHCISSRCNAEDELYCISLYLKTAIVGLSDNSLPLKPTELSLSNFFDKEMCTDPYTY